MKTYTCTKCGKTKLTWLVVNPVLGHYVGDYKLAKWCGPVKEESDD